MDKSAYVKPAVDSYTAEDLATVLGPAQGLSSGLTGTPGGSGSLGSSTVGRRGNGTLGR